MSRSADSVSTTGITFADFAFSLNASKSFIVKLKNAAPWIKSGIWCDRFFLGKDEKLLVSLDHIFSRTHGIPIPSEVTSPASGIKLVSAIKH